MKTPDKVLRIDGVAKMESGCLYVYGRTLLEVAKLIGHPVEKTTDGQPIYTVEMYRVDAEGIHVA